MARIVRGETLRCARAIVRILPTPDEYPLGARGARPVQFTILDDDAFTLLAELEMPGVRKAGKRLDCAWEAAPIIAQHLGCEGEVQEALNRRLAASVPLPGLQRYKDLGLNALRRGYQQEAIFFLLIRSWAVLGDPPRAGKTLDILSVFTLAGAKKLLVICPSLGKYVWAAETAKWLREEALILFGRGGADARTFCMACNGSGQAATGELDEYGLSIHTMCQACSGAGELTHTAHRLEPDQYKETWYQDTGRKKKDGSPRMQRRVAVSTVWPPVYRCPKHSDVTGADDSFCPKCHEEMQEVLARHSVIIANYDILGAQKAKSNRGIGYFRPDLPGWAPFLARHKFEMAALDESHRIRGFQPKKQKEQKMRREVVYDLVEPLPRVYALTGTFIYGFVRDAWAQLDVVSRGLFS